MGVLFAIFQMLAGSYIVLLFGNKIKAKYKSEAQEEQFLTVKTKYGKWLIIAGWILILTGVFSFVLTAM